MHANVAEHDEAITVCRDAADIFRETGARRSEGMAMGNIGNACTVSAWSTRRQTDRAAVCWRDAAAAMRDVGGHEKAAQLAANARSGRRRWRRNG